MSIPKWLWSCLFIALAVGCAQKTPPPPTLRVLTYNIHHAEGTDKKLDVERIAKVILDSKADLVAVQEVDLGTTRTNGLDTPAELARLTDMQYAYGPAMEFQGGKYGNLVLSKFTIASKKVTALPGSGGVHEPRSVVSTVCILDSGEPIVFASTHLDFTKEPSDRMRQATVLLAAFELERRPTILAGDFNCEIGSPPMALLERVWTNASASNQEKTCPADVPRVKIDHVLMRPAGHWRVVDVQVIPETVASDHRPVLVTLEQVQSQPKPEELE